MKTFSSISSAVAASVLLLAFNDPMRRGRTIFLETGIVHHPHDRADELKCPAHQDMPHGLDFPRRRGHELLQLLVIHAEMFTHGLHGFRTPIGHQTAQIQAPFLPPMLRPGERREHLLHERIQLGTGLGKLTRFRAQKVTGIVQD